MTRAVIICVGKLRASHWRDACAHYLRLLAHWRQVEVVEIRDGQGQTGIKKEGEEILARLTPQDFAIALHDKGVAMTSPQFATFLRQCDEVKMKRPAFIIGGPWGLAPHVLECCAMLFSLSMMTFPHDLARVLLLEQLYRAESILRHTPYHHG